MRANRPVARAGARLLFFAPLLAAPAIFPVLPDRPVAAGLLFAGIAAYARLAALAGGDDRGEERLLLLESLPFLAAAAAAYGRLDFGQSLVATAEGALCAAALVSAEFLALPRGSFAAALAFVAAAAAAGAAMDHAPPAAVAGGAALALAATGYAAARRRPRRGPGDPP